MKVNNTWGKGPFRCFSLGSSNALLSVWHIVGTQIFSELNKQKNIEHLLVKGTTINC